MTEQLELDYGPSGLGDAAHVASGTWPHGRVSEHGDWINLPNGARPAPFELAVEHVYRDAAALLMRKHERYGPRNISDAPGGPENGLRVRMWDKMARLNHLMDNPQVDPDDESLTDTVMDLMNYCAIFLLVRAGLWPSTKHELTHA